MAYENVTKAPGPSWASQTFSPLSNGLFRSIWMAGIVSNLGTMVQRIVAAWVMVTLAASPILVSLVQTVAVLPMMMFALIAGATADLFDKRLQMIIALSFCAVVAFVLWILMINDALAPWSLLLCTFLLGTGMSFYSAAWQSSVYEIVSPEKLSAAISLNGLSFNFARSVGPAIGAEVLALLGAALAFLTNALSYVVLIFALLGWRRKKDERELPREMLRGAIWDGLRFVTLSPAVRRIITRGGMFGFSGATLLCMPPLIIVHLGLGPRALGAILTGFGIGAVGGALMGARLRAQFGTEKVIFFSSVTIALTLAVMAASQWLILIMLAMAVAGAAWVLGISTFQVAVQLSCPRWVAGRTISIFNMGYFFGLASGSAVWGITTQFLGVPITLLISCGTFLLSILLGRFVPIVEPTTDDLQPLDPPPLPPLKGMDPRAGPIVVTVQYRVDIHQCQDFMQAMAALRVIRQRDGARKWILTQDLDDPELWIERFHSPTWADYLRRLSRRLKGDGVVYQNVHAATLGRPIYRRRVERTVGGQTQAQRPTDDPVPEVN